MSSFHEIWGYVAASLCGVVGIWGVLTRKQPRPSRRFLLNVYGCFAALILQVVLGVALYSGGTDPGNQHVFYGVVIAVTLSFVYIYRSQFRKRPNLYYGLVLLFSMGLAIRGIMAFGGNF